MRNVSITNEALIIIQRASNVTIKDINLAGLSNLLFSVTESEIKSIEKLNISMAPQVFEIKKSIINEMKN